MIGKILFFFGIIIIFAMLTGVNFDPAYHKFVQSRNTAMPYVDQVIENTLQYSSSVHLGEKIQPYINQVENAKN